MSAWPPSPRVRLALTGLWEAQPDALSHPPGVASQVAPDVLVTFVVLLLLLVLRIAGR